MYCPNCGTNYKDDAPAACAECGLPLEPVAGIIASNKGAIERAEALAREKRDRLIGSGLFVAVAAVPIALGVKNTLFAPSRKEKKELPPA